MYEKSNKKVTQLLEQHNNVGSVISEVRTVNDLISSTRACTPKLLSNFTAF